MAVLTNDLEVLRADVTCSSGAYLNVMGAEKVYTTAGSEFGPDKASYHPVIIACALYGLSWSLGKAWRDHMASTLHDFGYKSCRAGDPNIWMKAKMKKPDGFQYWSYIFVYTDGCMLNVDNEPKVPMGLLRVA